MNIIHPAKKRNNNQRAIQHDIKPLLILIQLCGQFPVNGISTGLIHFRYSSPKFLYFIFICGGMGFLTLVHIYGVLKYGADFNLISDLMFYGSIFLLNISFFNVAKKWENLMKEWNDMELYFINYGTTKDVKLRIKIMVISGGCTAIILYLMKIVNAIWITLECKLIDSNDLEYYFKNVFFKQIFIILGYSTFIGFLLKFFDFVAFFFWLLTDAFIIVMSTSLAIRFKQVNLKIKLAINQKLKIISWRDIRDHYNKLCKLCKLLDEIISPIIFVSFGYNLIAILIQLFNSLRSMRNNLEKAYFFISFGTVILRVIMVTLYGAWINDESKNPIRILNSASSNIFNPEIKRFIIQVSFDSVALTGREFFRITRSLVFSIAGAIVTYELVLIQFNENLLKENFKNISQC